MVKEYRGYVAANGLHRDVVSLRPFGDDKNFFWCPKKLFNGQAFSAYHTSNATGSFHLGHSSEVAFKVNGDNIVTEVRVITP